MASAAAPGSAPSPQSEAVADELQELSLQPGINLLPLQERKNVLQLKLQHRRTREELVSQGIMPPLKSPAAFHEQRRSLERARTEDYLKRKIRSRPERSELVRMHILEETSAEPSLQAKQLLLKRARLADDLNDKISHRPGPMELIHKNILPVHSSLKHTILETESLKAAVESSSLDEDSSDALSPEQPGSQDSPMGLVPLHSPIDALNCSNSNPSPTQDLTLPLFASVEPSQLHKLSGETGTAGTSRPTLSAGRSQAKASDRPSQRSKKPKESKPKVKKLKYHQYIPPDQKAEREPLPQMDSSYAKILQQQQLFLQLQILSQQQQQHYNYHTILPAPPKPPVDQQPPLTASSSIPNSLSAPTPPCTIQNGPSRMSQTAMGTAKSGALPTNLDDLKVAELKHELKLRGLPVSGTKMDLIERLRNHQEQSLAASNVPGSGAGKSSTTQQATMTMTQPFVKHFGSTSSSPPVSPTPSDRSQAAMSPDETSCNGDVFGEAVSTPLTQLSIHTSPQHQTLIKEESPGPATRACSFMQDAVDKDQMLQEKDKQIEELTRMLRQKQQLVESLRSQLEQGKRVAKGTGAAPVSMTTRVPTPVREEMKEAESEMESQPASQKAPQQDKAKPQPQQAPSVLLSQQSGTTGSTPSFTLDLLKMNPAPTLLRDSNGNHYLIAVTNRSALSKPSSRITLQRVQSTPSKVSSHSPPYTADTDHLSDKLKKSPSNQMNKKGQKTSLQVLTNHHSAGTGTSFSAPPNLQPFFLGDRSSPCSVGPGSTSSTEKAVEDALSSDDQQTLFTPPSSINKQMPPAIPPSKENGSCSQHMDDLFDILISSGEISASTTTSSASCLLVSSSPLSPPPSPLRISSPNPPSSTSENLCPASGRLEDFLESTTGKPLLGVEPDVPLTLIDDLHSQMLSTSSILDHPPSPMDTSELHFTSQPTGLDFIDPALDSMDWLDLSMNGATSVGVGLAPLNSHTPPSVFSTDFLDSSELQLHWDSCL